MALAASCAASRASVRAVRWPPGCRGGPLPGDEMERFFGVDVGWQLELDVDAPPDASAGFRGRAGTVGAAGGVGAVGAEPGCCAALAAGALVEGTFWICTPFSSMEMFTLRCRCARFLALVLLEFARGVGGSGMSSSRMISV